MADEKSEAKKVEELAGETTAAPKQTPVHAADDWMDLSLSGLMDEHMEREPPQAVEEFMAEAAEANETEVETVAEVAENPVPYISFEHVSKSFGEFDVLKDVSFYVYPGETLCILGRSGV